MNQFKDLGIKAPEQAYSGDKISLNRILNVPITVHRFKVEKSKFEKGDGNRLVLQIEKNENMHIVFTASMTLREMISKVPADKFPFQTVIKMINDRPEFT